MKRLILGWFAATLALAASAAAAQPRAESITYETGPCFGRCPVYRVTVSADGHGWFEGRNFTAVEGGRGFRLTRTQYDAFASRLAPYRPSGAEDIGRGHPLCPNPATDHPSATISWVRGGQADRLRFYFGCRDDRNEAMARALMSAPELLPIEGLIRPRQ